MATALNTPTAVATFPPMTSALSCEAFPVLMAAAAMLPLYVSPWAPPAGPALLPPPPPPPPPPPHAASPPTTTHTANSTCAFHRTLVIGPPPGDNGKPMAGDDQSHDRDCAHQPHSFRFFAALASPADRADAPARRRR